MITTLLYKSGREGLQSAGTMGQTLAKALGELPEFLKGNAIVHPHHICIELDDMAKQSIGSPFKSKMPLGISKHSSAGLSPEVMP